MRDQPGEERHLIVNDREELEELGLSADQIDAVLAWHRSIASMALARLMDYLLRGHRDGLRTRLLGVAFAFGLEGLHGYRNQAEAGAAEGVSKQAIQDAAKQARRAIQAMPPG